MTDYRKRVKDAVLAAWSSQAVVCDHSQIIPIGSLANAALSVRDEEMTQLRERVETAETSLALLRVRLRDLNAQWTHRATALAAGSGAAPKTESARMLAGADELDKVRFAVSALLGDDATGLVARIEQLITDVEDLDGRTKFDGSQVAAALRAVLQDGRPLQPLALEFPEESPAPSDEQELRHDQWCDCPQCAERGRNALRREKRRQA